jgi:hypothetical protein
VKTGRRGDDYRIQVHIAQHRLEIPVRPDARVLIKHIEYICRSVANCYYLYVGMYFDDGKVGQAHLPETYDGETNHGLLLP